MSPRESHPAQRHPQSTESPTALLKSCLSLVSGAAWGRRGKPSPGQIQPLMPASPPLHSPACPHPCQSLCTRRNTPRDCLLSCKPQLCRPLYSSSLHAVAGCLGRAAGILINIFFSILAFPCLGLLCSGNGAIGSASIVQTAGNPLNKAFTGSQLCQAPCTLGRGL